MLTQVQRASIETAKASFLEEANMAYSDKYSEEMKIGNFDYEVTLSDVKAKMSKGSIEERIPLGATYSITGFKVGNAEYVIGEGVGEKITTESPLKIPTEGTKTLEVKTGIEVNGIAGEKRYFALVQGVYYEIRIANSKIEYINENPMKLEEVNATGSSSASPTLGVMLKDGSSEIVTLGQVNQINQKVDITGVSTGNGILTVTYGTENSTVSEELNISVTGGYTVNFYNQKTDTNTIASYIVAENDDATNYPQYVIPANPPEEGKYFFNWLLSTNNSDATTSLSSVTQSLNIYANWQNPVKYAVQIYGINQDVDENNQLLGLTFGPAVGKVYSNAYVTHEYEPFNDNGTIKYYVKIITHTIDNSYVETTNSESNPEYLLDSNGNYAIRTEEQKNKYDKNIHEMSWEEIAIQSKEDPTVFTDCMLCGDTKSVYLNLNSIIRNNYVQVARGDGAGILESTINSYYRKWNPSQNEISSDGTGIEVEYPNLGLNAKNAGGYRTSHIRATLIGSIPDEIYAGNVNLNTTNCLYSCIENELRNQIVAKNINYVVGTGLEEYDLGEPKIADKIWLFSMKELGFSGYYSGNGIEGIGVNGEAYQKFTYNEIDNSKLTGKSKYFVAAADSSNDSHWENVRVAYKENYDNENSGKFWWSRSPYLDTEYGVQIIGCPGYYGHRYTAEYGERYSIWFLFKIDVL